MPKKTARIFFIDPEVLKYLSSEDISKLKTKLDKIATLNNSNSQEIFFVPLDDTSETYHQYKDIFTAHFPKASTHNSSTSHVKKTFRRFSSPPKQTLFSDSQNNIHPKTFAERIDVTVKRIKANDSSITETIISVFITPESASSILPSEKFSPPITEINVLKNISLEELTRHIRKSLSRRVYCIDTTDITYTEMQKIIEILAPKILREEALLFFVIFNSVLKEKFQIPIDNFRYKNAKYDNTQFETLKKFIFIHSIPNHSQLQLDTIINQVNLDGKNIPIFSEKIIFFTQTSENKKMTNSLIPRFNEKPSEPLPSQIQTYLALQETHNKQPILLRLKKTELQESSDTETSSSTSLLTDSPLSSPSTSVTPPEYKK